MRAERCVVLRDLRDGGPDPARDGDAHPIGAGRGPPAAPAEARCSPELLRDRFQLGSRAARSPEIVARLGVPELLPELANAPSIRSLRLCVEDVARVAEVTDDLAVNGGLGLRRHLGVRWNERGERRHANLRSRIAQQVNEQ